MSALHFIPQSVPSGMAGYDQNPPPILGQTDQVQAIWDKTELQIAAASSPHAIVLTSIAEDDLVQHRNSEFFKRMSDEKWNAALEHIASLNHVFNKEEIEALEKGRWTHPIFSHPNWIYLALQARLQNKLSEQALSKLCLFDTCQRHVEAENLLESGSSDMQIFQLYSEEGALDKTACALLHQATKNYLDHNHFGFLLHEMAKWEPEETQFFVVRRKSDELLEQIMQPGGVEWDFLTLPPETLSDRLNSSLRQVVPPPDFAYAIYKARFPHNAMEPLPSVDFSLIAKLSHVSKRPVSIPAFFANFPETVHGSKAKPLSVYYHDIAYHLPMESANMHRRIWIDFALFLKENAKNARNEQKEQLLAIVPTVLDRDFPNYLKKVDPKAPHSFWISMAYCIESIRIGHFDNKRSPEYRAFRDKFIELFIDFYYDQKQCRTLRERYRLRLDSLFECRDLEHDFITASDKRFFKKLYQALQNPLE